MDKKSAQSARVTRRVVLTGGVGCALTLALPRFTLGAPGERVSRTTRPLGDERSALYVFRGAENGATVIAATCAAPRLLQSELRIHSFGHDSTYDAAFDLSTPMSSSQNGLTVFVGEILTHGAAHTSPLYAVVIEAPSQLIACAGRTQIWAEQLFSDGSRFRIGSSFLAHLAARHENVAEPYHRGSPAEDGEPLRRAISTAVASNARVHGYAGNSERYGSRVAAALTPDAVHYDPLRPVGFTFAAQNGRHPSDPALTVVETVLNGVLASASATPAARLERQFPYFSRPSVAV